MIAKRGCAIPSRRAASWIARHDSASATKALGSTVFIATVTD
jgi:hypothetical protein